MITVDMMTGTPSLTIKYASMGCPPVADGVIAEK